MNSKFGDWGERAAADYLKKKGYVMVFRNYRRRQGELDIIAEKDAVLIFVEVKSRTGLEYGLPCEAVTKEKMRHIIMVACCFLNERENREKYKDYEYRFDVIEVLRKGGKNYIHQIENAF